MAGRQSPSGNWMYESFQGIFSGLTGTPGSCPGQAPPAGQGSVPAWGAQAPGSYSDPPDHLQNQQQHDARQGGQVGWSPTSRNNGGPGPGHHDDRFGRSPHEGDSRRRSPSRNRSQEFSRDGGRQDNSGGPQKPWQGESPSRELSIGQQSTGPPPSASSSGTHTPASFKARTGPYIAVTDDSDLLDQHVAYYFKHHPDVYRRHPLVRKREGVYVLHGREIVVEWQYNPDPQKQGFLVVNDWPLRQPFADYMQQTEANAEYDHVGNKASLGNIPREQRLTFDDKGSGYSRLEAMKVAKEQAVVREKAASLVQQGQVVPQQELIARYEKTMRAKLGRNRQSADCNNRRSSPSQTASAPQLPVPAAQPRGQEDHSRSRDETPSASGYPGAVGGPRAVAASGGWPAMPKESTPHGAAPWPGTGSGPPNSQGLVQPNLFGASQQPTARASPAVAAPRYAAPSGQRYGFA